MIHGEGLAYQFDVNGKLLGKTNHKGVPVAPIRLNVGDGVASFGLNSFVCQKSTQSDLSSASTSVENHLLNKFIIWPMQKTT